MSNNKLAWPCSQKTKIQQQQHGKNKNKDIKQEMKKYNQQYENTKITKNKNKKDK